VFKSDSRHILGDFTLGFYGFAAQVKLRIREVSGLTDPLVLAVFTAPGADGERIETALFAIREGRVVPLLPLVLNLEMEDALCLREASGSKAASVVAIRSFTGDQCFVCWPKLYQASSFEWDGRQFKYSSDRRTRAKYDSWKPAAKELGLACTDEVDAALNTGKDPR
jgi:hypothetical protein